MMDIHDSITRSTWKIQTWDNNEVQFNDKKLLEELDELERTKQIKPLTSSTTSNILTRVGLVEIAKSRLPTGAKTNNTHYAVGTGNRLESLADTELQVEVGRRAITSYTQHATEERYATAFNRSHVGNEDREISETGIMTAESGGILILRTTTDQPGLISATKTVTVSTTISHRNATTP